MRKQSMKSIKHVFVGVVAALVLIAGTTQIMAQSQNTPPGPIAQRTLEFFQTGVSVFIDSGYAIKQTTPDAEGNTEDIFDAFGFPVPADFDLNNRTNLKEFPREGKCQELIILDPPIGSGDPLFDVDCFAWDFRYTVDSTLGLTITNTFASATQKAAILHCSPNCEVEGNFGGRKFRSIPKIHTLRFVQFLTDGTLFQVTGTVITSELNIDVTDAQVITSKQGKRGGTFSGPLLGPGDSFDQLAGLPPDDECLTLGPIGLFRLQLLPEGARRAIIPKWSVGECGACGEACQDCKVACGACIDICEGDATCIAACDLSNVLCIDVCDGINVACIDGCEEGDVTCENVCNADNVACEVACVDVADVSCVDSCEPPVIGRGLVKPLPANIRSGNRRGPGNAQAASVSNSSRLASPITSSFTDDLGITYSLCGDPFNFSPVNLACNPFVLNTAKTAFQLDNDGKRIIKDPFDYASAITNFNCSYFCSNGVGTCDGKTYACTP